MKHVATLLLLFAFSCFAQKAPIALPANGDFLFLPTHQTTVISGNSSVPEIQNTIKNLAEFESDIALSLVHQINSKVATHFHFHILKGDYLIYANTLHAVSYPGKKLTLLNLPTIPNDINGEFPAAGAAEQIRQQYGAQHISKSEKVLAYSGGDALSRALLVEIEGPETIHKAVLVQNNEIIYEQDLHKYHSAQGPNDTAVSVSIFEPDPLTTAQVSYGPPYNDNNDQTSIELEAEMKMRSTTMTFDNGVIRAENDAIKLIDFSLPAIQPVSSSSPQMHFTRDTSYFEDINVIYHITNHKEHLSALGYPGLPSYQIHVDPHALDGGEMSFFSTTQFPYRLYFGEGGVDDAEDAEVVLHEFSHAVIYEASPAGSISIERGCIEEALCDYFAASYSQSITSFNGSRMFSWDSGDGSIWPGRHVHSTKNYGTLSFKNGSYYSNTDVFASCLMRVYDEIGRSKTDELVLEALFSLTGNTSMPDFAGFMLLADTALNGGINSTVITQAFVERNIIPTISLEEQRSIHSAAMQVYNTAGFARGQALSIHSTEELIEYKLYNIGGVLTAKGILNHSKEAELFINDITPGVYVLTLKTMSGAVKSFKLLRY